jgi:hypothetical protein
VINHYPRRISKFVNTIYSYDYAPLQHLKSKTRYLNKTPSQAIIIFVRNEDPLETYSGKGQFRHIECLRVKKLKNEIRESFNPRIGGQRTEEHVIHASDNEDQVDFLLRHLGVREGISIFKNKPNPILDSPYYIKPFKRFSIRKIRVKTILCSVFERQGLSIKKVLLPVEQTPHYLYLINKNDEYNEYLEMCREFGQMKSDYSLSKFSSLAENFAYLSPPHDSDYIHVKCIRPNQYLVLDGLHRLSILRFRGADSVLVAVIDRVTSLQDFH